MAKMKAIDAAVLVLEKEGVTVTFGVPGAPSTRCTLQ
jgi:tartronate-semialdehyde synthase